MLAVAVLIPLVAGAYDLSIGATINFSTIVVVVLQTSKHWNMWPAMLAAVGCGALIGAVNGFLIVRLKISSFIATLGMATIITAFQEIVSGQSQPLPPTSPAWNHLTQVKVAGFQIVVLYMLVIAAVAWWALEHTPPGRYLYAIGGNSEAARLSGVNVDKWIWLSLLASGVLSGVAGVFYASLTGPSLTFGSALLLPAFAAAFLGSTQLKPGRFNVWGSILAIFVLATGVKGLELVTGKQWLNDMFNGVALIAAVAFALWRQRVAGRRPDAREDRSSAPSAAGRRPGSPEDRSSVPSAADPAVGADRTAMMEEVGA
jgi:ribose transport system permease protein